MTMAVWDDAILLIYKKNRFTITHDAGANLSYDEIFAQWW